MAWAKNGNAVGTGSTSFDMTLDTNSIFNMILVNSVEQTQNQEFQFNSDTGNNYSRRWESNGSENTQTSINGAPNAGTAPSMSVSYILNIATKEKLIMSFSNIAQTAGAGNAPSREAQYEKWTNTTDQINTIKLKNETTAVNFTSSSDMTAIGSDLTPAAAVTALGANVQVGSRYEETDTRKMYDRQPIAPTTSSNFPDGNNGTNGSRIDIPTTGLTSLTNGSVAFWVYPLEAATDAADFVILSGSDSSAASTEMIFGFIGNTSKVGIHARSGGSWLLRLDAGSLPKSQWSHVVYTNSTSSGNKVYVNGTEVTPSYTNGSASSNVFFNNMTTNTFTIGANKDSGGYQWGMEGNVQQVLIYNTTLSASDVTTLYNSGNYNSSPSSTGLLRRYELTSDVNDSSGNSQNGTATSISFTSLAASELTWQEIGA